VARKTPLGKIKDAAVTSLKHPLGTAGKAVETARGTAAIGTMVAGQVTRTAAGVAVEGVKVVTGRRGREGASQSVPADTTTQPSSTSGQVTEPVDKPASSERADLRPVPSVNEPGHPTDDRGAGSAQAVADTAKQQGDPTKPDQVAPQRQATSPGKAATQDSAATVSTAKKAPAKKAPTKKTAAKKAAPAKKAATAKKSAAPAKAPSKKAAEAIGEPDPDPTPIPDVTPADVAEVVAKKAPATKAAQKAAEKAPAKKAAPRSTPSDVLPVSSEVPDEPLIDPSLTKAVQSEAEIGQQAADPDKG
jgi:hypothetical protein